MVDNGMGIIDCSLPLQSMETVQSTDIETWPIAEGLLTAKNGAATMKYDGEWRLVGDVDYFADDGQVTLRVQQCDGPLSGDIGLSATDAARLGTSLLHYAEHQYSGVDNE